MGVRRVGLCVCARQRALARSQRSLALRACVRCVRACVSECVVSVRAASCVLPCLRACA